MLYFSLNFDAKTRPKMRVWVKALGKLVDLFGKTRNARGGVVLKAKVD